VRVLGLTPLASICRGFIAQHAVQQAVDKSATNRSNVV